MTEHEMRLAIDRLEAELESVRESIRPLLLDLEERKQQNRLN